MLRKALLATAAVLAAVFLWLLATLPARPAVTTGSVDDRIRRRTVAGAFHVHSTRSDGTAGREEIAAAASRAGLQFVVLTDHGDGTRPPDPPEYIHGVLMIDAVEISTNGGHYIALDMRPSPYPLGGEAAAVVEDVDRLGGFGIVAHGGSAKEDLRWTDWSLPVGGLEWLNLDSEWRDESRGRLARAGIDYMFRKGPALATLLDRPAAVLERLDLASRSARHFVAVAGHDAHGGWTAEDGWPRILPRVPSYEGSFRAFAVRALLDAEPSGRAADDARLLLVAFRAGSLFTAIDAIAGPAWVDYHATLPDGQQYEMGPVLRFIEGTTLTFRSTLPKYARMVLMRDGAPVAESSFELLQATAPGPGGYRVEVTDPRAPGNPPVPWLVTNPIYLAVPPPAVVPSPIKFGNVRSLTEPVTIEKDTDSVATLTTDDAPREGQIRRKVVAYRLGPRPRGSHYAALSVRMPADRPSFDAIEFTARASSPMRVSVQLRFDTLRGARWGRSVYVSPELRRHVVHLDRLVSLDRASKPPQMSSASSILFVVDLTNARPGGEGRFEISDLNLVSVVRSNR